ncbi:MAG: metal-sensing transcriptional repressor [Patescibacteria group bacterium]|nr:metal-sensing transcriptional repressor [Patescibacteria group bacterium]
MTYRPKDTQERILHRLKIARGHLEKVIQMVEGGEYCIDVINQSRAVQSALKEVDSLTLENHLKTCVVDHIKSGEIDNSIMEIMKVIKSDK